MVWQVATERGLSVHILRDHWTLLDLIDAMLYSALRADLEYLIREANRPKK